VQEMTSGKQVVAAPAKRGLSRAEAVALLIACAVVAIGLGVAITRGSLLWAGLALAVLAVFIVFRLGYSSVILVLCLYAGLASNTYSLVSFRGKTLTLSAGDIGMFVVTGILLLGVMSEMAMGKDDVLTVSAGARPIVLPLAALGLLFLLSTLWAGIGPLASRINFEVSLLSYARWLVGPVALLLLANSAIKPERFRTVVALLAVIFAVGYASAALFGQKQIETVVTGGLSPFMRISGMFSEPNEMGQIAVLFLVILVAYELVAPKARRNLLVWVLAAGLASMVFLTQSREALISLLVSAVVLGFFLVNRNRKVAAVVLLGLLAFSVVMLLQIPRFANTITDVRSGAAVSALNGRDEVWAGAWEVASEHTLTGIGFENLGTLTEGRIWEAHNGFMQAAMVSGVLGFLAYVWLVLNTGRYLLRYSRERDGTLRAIFTALFCVFIGYMVTSLVSDHFVTFYVYSALFWGMVGLALGALHRVGKERVTLEDPASAVSAL
jgi:O-antigen ligase